MYTMMKRLTSLLLAVCMLTAFLPAGMFSASAAVDDTYVYDFDAAGIEAGNVTTDFLSASTFDTLAQHSGSSTNALWRFVKGSFSTADSVKHYGNTTNTGFGVFLFDSNDSAGKTATFEISIPEDGEYDLFFVYADYSRCRKVNVYLTPVKGAISVIDANCKLGEITPSGSSTRIDVTHPFNEIKVAKGNYYLTFQTATNISSTLYHFTLKSLTLKKTSDTAPVAKPLTIIGNTGTLLTAARQLYARILPYSVSNGGFADQTSASVTWGSSRPEVATVANGLVTPAGTAGSAVIYAKTGDDGNDRREMVSVLTGNSNSQLYAINEDAQKYMRDANATDVDFTETYTSYDHTTVYDEWCYAHSSNPSANRVAAYTSNANSWYGTFLDISGIGRTVTFQIKVENDGNYLPEIAYIAAPSTIDEEGNRGGSVSADVFIYPTTYAAGSCPEESYIGYTGSNPTSRTLSMLTGSSQIALRAGDYYVTFKTTSDTGRYVYLQHIALLYQGGYSAPAVDRIVISNPTPKMTAGDTTYKLGVRAVPSTADQTVTNWAWAKDQNQYVSITNGVLTASSSIKGSNVISATVGGIEEVTSVSTGALLYSFNNAPKAYLAATGNTSVDLKEQFSDYSWHDTYPYGDKWAFAGQDAHETIYPTVYQGMGNNNERYGAFLDFGFKDGKWVRFKIKVDKGGWYFPEVLYRDNGPKNMREVDVYISPTNVDPFTLQVMTVTPDEDAPGVGEIKAKRGAESMYLAEGEYYLTFYTGVNNYPETSHYLYLYHLALVEDDASKDKVVPKAVVITKPDDAMKPLAVGDTVTLTARVLPMTAIQTITSWKSSNEDVAIVDATGNVTAVGEGVALITATARDARSESVVIQVGEDSQVYAFNEVIKKYLEVGDDAATNGRRVNISENSTFTSKGYLWKNVYNFGQGWRFVEKTSDSISNVYRGDSAQDDGGNDNTDPNYKYGLFLLSNSNDSYVRFEIDVEEAGEYLPEIIHYLSVNASDTQGSRQAEIYISPIATPEAYLMHDAYYVGTTMLAKQGARDGIVTDYGLIHHTLNPIMLEAGTYNLVIKSSGLIGRYLYLHAIALNRLGEYKTPNPVDVVFTNNADETVFLGANATYTLNKMLHSLLASQEVTWASSDSSIASVDQNGTITAGDVVEGTALITATSKADNTIVGKVRVIIGEEANPTYKYDFVTPVRPIANNTEINSGSNISLFDYGFDDSYTAAINGGSDPWMIYRTTDPAQYCSYTQSTHKDGYGVFVMSSKDPGTYIQFKFEVDEDANYGTVLNISDWSKSNDFEVYLAPITATNPMAARWRVGHYEITKLQNLTYGLELGEQTLYAGEYILTVKSTDVNYLGTNGGLVALHNLSLYRTGDAFYTIEGAQVRIKGPNQFGTQEDQGLRFISTIHKSEYNVDSSEIEEFGTILLPQAMLDEGDDGSDLTFEKYGSSGAAKVAAKNRYVDNIGYTVFTAVVTGLEPPHYDMVIVARAYVKLKNNAGYIYGDTWTERSIYQVAKNGLERAESFKEGEKEALEQIVAEADALNDVE